MTDVDSRATGESAADVRVEVLADAASVEWDALVDASPEGSFYHRAAWRALISDTFGHDTHYLCARDRHGRLVGALPLVRLRSMLFGDYCVSVPYFNFGGAIGVDDAVERKLIASACELAKKLGVSHIEMRDGRPRDGWSNVRTDKVLMLLDLPATEDDLWKGLGSKLRSQIKRPQKEGATSEIGGVELLEDFYRVFSRNMRDLGTPVYSKRFFARILQAFPEQARIVIVRMSGQAVAAGFLVDHRHSLEIPWASSLREFNRFSVNMLLYWESLRHAVDRGKKQFDFGRSSRDSGTFKFKAQWGAQPKQLYWHYWLNDGARMPNLTPHNPKFQLAIRVWQQLPLVVTQAIGPSIVKNLP